MMEQARHNYGACLVPLPFSALTYGSVDPVSVLQKCHRSSFRRANSSAARRNRSRRKLG